MREADESQLLQGTFYKMSDGVESFMEASVMKCSRRHLLTDALALAGVLTVLPALVLHWADAAPATDAPIGQTIWLQTTNTHTYVSTRLDQPNAPLQATSTQVQAWEAFAVIDAGQGLIALRSQATNQYVSARLDQPNAPLHAVAPQIQLWEQFTWLSQGTNTIALQSAANSRYVSARTDQPHTPLHASATALQQWEQFRWAVVNGAATPNFGSNVSVFDPTMSSATIQTTLNAVFNQQQTNQFGTNRSALIFKPGVYKVDVNLGFYTQVLGLGYVPDEVTINGAVHVSAAWMQGNATQNFWRGAENLAVIPPSGTSVWAVSQAAPFRRMDVQGNMKLDDGGWSSGGFLADTSVSGQVNSGTQQQWISRNAQWGSWTGSNWNMVFVGVNGAPGQSFPKPPYTVVGQVPVIREKPFLYVDHYGNYSVWVPALRTNAQGTSWASGSPTGTSIPLNQFYIAHPGDAAATINTALAQ